MFVMQNKGDLSKTWRLNQTIWDISTDRIINDCLHKKSHQDLPAFSHVSATSLLKTLFNSFIFAWKTLPSDDHLLMKWKNLSAEPTAKPIIFTSLSSFSDFEQTSANRSCSAIIFLVRALGSPSVNNNIMSAIPGR